MTAEIPTIRVMALHALAYCERLYYLEEVEEIRVADAAVWAGRRLHEELGEPADIADLTIESAELGIRGRLDAMRRRDGSVYPIEHKRGRCRSADGGGHEAWDSDTLQALAYAMLLEEHLGRSVEEARIRYHASNATVRIKVDDRGRQSVRDAVARARELAQSSDRPPITTEERRCARCSLAPVCLPEEGRLAHAVSADAVLADKPTPTRLFPPDTERRSLHVVSPRARVGRSGANLTLKQPDESPKRLGSREVSDVVLHGHAQITTQALRLCAKQGIPVHLVTTSGAYLGAFGGHSPAVQRRVRQYRGLTDSAATHQLAQRLIVAKTQLQLQHILRASRKSSDIRANIEAPIAAIRRAIAAAASAPDRDTLMGHEGSAARAYFQALPALIHSDVSPQLKPEGRTRRPPRDRFNALLSFAYGLLYRDLVSAILRVGLEPAFGVLHQPRSSAYPLALDLMELFRVPIVDIAVLGAVNRRTFDADQHFTVTGPQVWLSEEGRRRLIAVYERRKHEEYRHPAIGYTISYARMLELEARLLEKEWSGEPGLFARLRIR